MDDNQTPAEIPAGDEADPATKVQVATETDQPEPRAADDAAPDAGEGDNADEAESRSKKRREERRKALDAVRAEADAKAAEARRATENLERIRKAGEAKKAPLQAEFENYDDYIAARAVYAARRAADEDRAEGMTAEQTAAEQAAQNARQRAAAEAASIFTEAAAEARTKYTDFDAVVMDRSVPISAGLAEMIAFSDSPAELAYAVAKDRALAGRLSSMHPVEAARELGRMEARLSAPKPRVESNAPEPISPVRGKASAARDPLKMNANEYAEWREKGGTF